MVMALVQGAVVQTATLGDCVERVHGVIAMEAAEVAREVRVTRAMVTDTGATGATANSSRASRKAKRNRGKAEGPILCIDTISAIPNTNSSGARVPVRYGNVVRMRSQRSYLQGTALVESVV